MKDKWYYPTKLAWLIKELIKMYSDSPSFFSRKRVEGGIAFIVLQWGLIHWLILNVEKCTSSDLWVWATVQCFICGYTLSKIEDIKK